MSQSSFEYLEVTEHDDHIVEIVINRPDALNALNAPLLAELEKLAGELKGRTRLGSVILTGKGRAFVAGADIKAMLEQDASEARAFGEQGHATMRAIEEIPAPVLAAVNGFALGGGLELALSCDLIYASTKAKMGLPEVGLGLIPGFGGTQRLGRTIGFQAARELVYTAEMISAEKAHRLGLVVSVHEPDALLDHVRQVARTISSRGPRAVHTAKRVMAKGSDETKGAGLSRELDAFEYLFGHEEPREGMRAHLEKRDPDFWGLVGE